MAYILGVGVMVGVSVGGASVWVGTVIWATVVSVALDVSVGAGVKVAVGSDSSTVGVACGSCASSQPVRASAAMPSASRIFFMRMFSAPPS